MLTCFLLMVNKQTVGLNFMSVKSFCLFGPFGYLCIQKPQLNSAFIGFILSIDVFQAF